jgi:DNA-binding Xre family transcriptional regulator
MELNIKAIKMGMINKCMSTQDLSKASGLSMATVNRIVNRGKTPRIPTIGKLAKALDLSPQDILLQE